MTLIIGVLMIVVLTALMIQMFRRGWIGSKSRFGQGAGLTGVGTSGWRRKDADDDGGPAEGYR